MNKKVNASFAFAIRNMSVLKQNTKLKEQLSSSTSTSSNPKEYEFPKQSDYAMVAEAKSPYGNKDK